jgi:hypothetical protein
MTKTFIWVVASIVFLVWTSPVWSALVAALSPPTGLADAEVGSIATRRMAKSMVAIQMACRLVTEMPLPSTLTDTSMRVVQTGSVLTSSHLLADITIVSRPSIQADTFIGCKAVSICAIVAAGNVTIGSLPTFIAVAFKCFSTSTMITSRQGNTDVTVGTFPSNLAGTVVGSSAFSMNATRSIVLADWLQTRVQLSFLILIAWLLPA